MVVLRSNTGLNVEVAKLLIFNRDTSKISGFLMACRLFIGMKMRDASVEE